MWNVKFESAAGARSRSDLRMYPTDDDLKTILAESTNAALHQKNCMKFEAWYDRIVQNLPKQVSSAQRHDQTTLEVEPLTVGNATRVPGGWALPNGSYVSRCLLKLYGYNDNGAFVQSLYEKTGLSQEVVLDFNILWGGNPCGPADMSIWCRWRPQPRIPEKELPEEKRLLTKNMLIEYSNQHVMTDPEIGSLNDANRERVKLWLTTVLSSIRNDLIAAAKDGKLSYTTPQVAIVVPKFQVGPPEARFYENSSAYLRAFRSLLGDRHKELILKTIRKECRLDESLKMEEISSYAPNEQDGYVLSIKVSWS